MNVMKMIDVVLSAGAVTPERVVNRSVAVIDVFRATSVIVQALKSGARAMVPVVTIAEAMALRERYGRRETLLCGERNAEMIEGFDKDNSPLSYMGEDIVGKTLVQTTSNGTRAINAARQAHQIYIAAFINMSAVCDALALSGRDVTLVCSGRDDRFTAEDGLCAGAMVNVLVKRYGYHTSDIAEVMQRMYVEVEATDLKQRLSTTLHYNDILSRGYGDDIDFCLQRDIYDVVPYYSDKGEILLTDR